MSLIVIGMSFSKHPVTFEMLSGENVTASSSPPGVGEGFPTPQCSCLMVSTLHPPGGTQPAAKLQKPSRDNCVVDSSSCSALLMFRWKLIKQNWTERFSSSTSLAAFQQPHVAGGVLLERTLVSLQEALSHHSLSRVCVFVTVALGVRSKEVLPLFCLESCLLTVGNLKANLNWMALTCGTSGPSLRLSRCLKTKAMGPEL